MCGAQVRPKGEHWAIPLLTLTWKNISRLTTNQLQACFNPISSFQIKTVCLIVVWIPQGVVRLISGWIGGCAAGSAPGRAPRISGQDHYVVNPYQIVSETFWPGLVRIRPFRHLYRSNSITSNPMIRTFLWFNILLPNLSFSRKNVCYMYFLLP